MTLATQILTDAKKVFVNDVEFGEAITYTPAGGSAKPITALVDASFDVETGTLVDTRQSIVIMADATLGIALPKPGDIATIRGRFCRVEDVILGAEDGLHELQVEVKPP